MIERERPGVPSAAARAKESEVHIERIRAMLTASAGRPNKR
jgi:hypothetical protein